MITDVPAIRRIRRVLAALSSLQLTTIGLLALFAIVLAGTLYQVGHSIHDTTSAIFHAWVYWWGPVPLPAGQTVFAVLGLNLVAAMIIRIPWRLEKAGLLIVHLGLLLMVIGGLATRFFVRESLLALAEGESDTYSYDPRRWDLVVKSETGETVFSLPASDISPYGTIERYLPDAVPLSAGYLETRNVQGWRDLRAAEANRGDPVPGMVIAYRGEEILLHGADRRPTTAPDGTTFLLRPRRYVLPVSLELEEFHAEFYQDSDVPRDFSSRVLVNDGGVEREVIIAMNKPLYVHGTTFYQLAYNAADPNREVSVFSVVRNPARWLPYAVSLLITAGLFLHLAQRGRGARASGGI